jgi:putative oxidoreductase
MRQDRRRLADREEGLNDIGRGGPATQFPAAAGSNLPCRSTPPPRPTPLPDRRPTMTVSTMLSSRDGSFVARLEALRDALGAFPLWLLELGMRVSVAAVFFKSGLTKIASWETTLSLFADEYRLPLLPTELAAVLGTATELSAPVLLAFGLFARFGAAALLGMTLVIQFLVYPANWAEHLMWGTILAGVVSRGPGALSLDRLIARHLFGRD